MSEHYEPETYWVKPWGDGHVCTHSLFASPTDEGPVEFPNPYKLYDNEPDEAPPALYVKKNYRGDAYYSSLHQACDREPPPKPGTGFVSAIHCALYDLVQMVDGFRNGDRFILWVEGEPKLEFRVMQFHVVKVEEPVDFAAGAAQCVSDWHGAGLEEIKRLDRLFYNDEVPGCSQSFRFGYMTAAYNLQNQEMKRAFVERWPHA